MKTFTSLAASLLALIAAALLTTPGNANSEASYSLEQGTSGPKAAATAQATGKPYFWFRVWPDKFVKFDIELDQVVLEVKSTYGIAHSSQLTHDRTRFLLVTGQKSKIEVIDAATGEVKDLHNFEDPEYIVRIDDVMEVPGGTHWYVKIDRIKRELDHFKVEEPQWLLYDHTEWNIDERMKELPKAIRRSARLSPDGSQWHIMRDDITVIDPESMEEVGKIELSKPLYSGMGAISLRGEDFYDYRNPAAYKMVYSMRDPVKKNRSLGGVVEIDLVEHKISKLHEWGAAPRVRRFYLTADKKLGIATKSSSDRREQSNGDDPQAVLVNYDMETGKKLLETRVDLRNGLRLAGISPDGQKLYFTGRGHELVLFSGDHKPLKTINLGGETDGRLQLRYE